MPRSKSPDVIRRMKYSAMLSTVAGVTTASLFHDETPGCCFATLSDPCRSTVRTAAMGYRALFERELMRCYGLTPADCATPETLDREIAEAIRHADGHVLNGVNAMVNAIGEKYDLNRLRA